MTICDTCNDIPNIPIVLPCTHLLCFLCIGVITECPICAQDIINLKFCENKDKHHNYLWLYSSNFNHKWWCYSTKLNSIVENIYEDYTLIKDMDKKFDEMNLGIKINKKHSNKNKTFDIKDFTEFDINSFDKNTDVQFEDDDNINLKMINPQQAIQKKSDIKSYIIKVCSNEYRIDFDTMKQINIDDFSKSRRIKRVQIPESLIGSDYQTIINYLKIDLYIIGVSGIILS